MPHDEKLLVVVDPRDVAFKMKTEYSRGVKDQTEKVLEAMIDLCRMFEQSQVDISVISKEAAELISKRLGIASVAIAIRDPVDKLFRYVSVVGVDEENIEGFKKLVYTEEQVTDESMYKSYVISDQTRLYLDEDHPYAPGEESTYRRPGLLDMKRRSITEALEADYVDVFFRQKDGRLMGWIELSGTRMRMLPNVATIKWVELLSYYLSIALRLRRLEASV
jgi:hypothetical protein